MSKPSFEPSRSRVNESVRATTLLMPGVMLFSRRKTRPTGLGGLAVPDYEPERSNPVIWALPAMSEELLTAPPKVPLPVMLKEAFCSLNVWF